MRCFRCFCWKDSDAQEPPQPRMQQPPKEGEPQQKAKAIFMRIIRGLTRSEEEEEAYQTASEGEGSPPRADEGHLTARSNSAPSSRPLSRSQSTSHPHSRRVSAGGGGGGDGGGSPAEPPQAPGSAGASPASGRRWGAVLGGVPFLPGIPTLIHALTPRQSEGQEGAEAPAPAGTPPQQPQHGPEQQAGAGPATAALADQQQEQQQQQAAGEERAEGQAGGGPPQLHRVSATFPGLRVEEGAEPAEPDLLALQADTAPPAPLQPGSQPLPELSEPSALMSEAHIRALAAAVPARHRGARWSLLYSTQRDGISLQTMLRNCKGRAPTVLVVRDMGRYVFGSFCSEPWRLSNRYYGTGETFVFQLEPRQVAWYWWYRKMAVQRNDFFMWGGNDAIAVGGAGGYALWLDPELSRGLSRSSATFGNDSLSSQEDFQVGSVELWWLN